MRLFDRRIDGSLFPRIGSLNPQPVTLTEVGGFRADYAMRNTSNR